MSAINDIENAWDNNGLAFFKDSNLNRLMLVLATQLDRISEDAQDIYDQQHIQTATGEQLEKLGRPVDIRRRTGESDVVLRRRIITEYTLQRMESTMDEVIEFLTIMLEGNGEDIEITTNYTSEYGAITVSVQEELYTEAGLTIDDIETFANRVVPAGHRVILQTLGTFRITNDDMISEDGFDPDAGLTADNITTGGTLATDVGELE